MCSPNRQEYISHGLENSSACPQFVASLLLALFLALSSCRSTTKVFCRSFNRSIFLRFSMIIFCQSIAAVIVI